MPGEAQIAYGAEGRVAGLLAAADLTGSDGFIQLAGLAGGWFFGANPSGRATYDPATGATFDGVEADGRINANSGAESTIHGLLAMLGAGRPPRRGRLAASITGYAFHGLSVVEAESGVLAGGATVVPPPSAWTGAANWSGGAYVTVPAGGSVTFDVTGHDGDLVHPIVNRRPGGLGTSTYFAVDARGRRTVLGRLANGGLKDSGVVEADGLLKPFPLDRALPGGTVAVVVESSGDLQLDALLMQPVVSTVVTPGGPAPLRSSTPTRAPPRRASRRGRPDLAGRGRPTGPPIAPPSRGPTITVAGGGFAITT